MLKCPNYKSPEWKSHLGAVGADYASATWSLNGGNPLNLTPDGNPSGLFEKISKALNTSDFETIAKVKRDLLLDGTIQGLDSQGEPIVSNFDKIIDNYKKGVFKTIPTNTPYKEFLSSNEQYRVLLNSYRKNPKLNVNVGVLDVDSDKANVSLNSGESIEEGKQRLIDLGYHPRTIGVRQPLKNAARKDKSLVVMNYEEQNNVLNNMLDTLDERNEFGKPLYSILSSKKNSVNFQLKVVNALIDKILPFRKTIRLNSKDKPNIEINLKKALRGKGVPKEQIDFIFDYMKSNNIQEMSTEQLALELASKYSFAVEINTAKEKKGATTSINFEENPFLEESDFQTEGGNNTKYYSKISAPGDINESKYEGNPDWVYHELEISTPLITPSIKGHAKFATPNGIGWVRVWYNKKTRVVEIQEIQSDLFQKGRDKDNLITKQGKVEGDEDLIPKINFIKIPLDEYLIAENNGERIDGVGVKENGYSPAYRYNGKIYTEIDIDEYGYLNEEFDKNTSENQFLQLLNKDNNWVTFFIKSIIQDSAKKGYEKVLFPKGETAAKIEGHETIVETISRINIKLEKEKLKLNADKYIIDNGDGTYDVQEPNQGVVRDIVHSKEEGIEIYNKRNLNKINLSIKALEQEKANLKSQGIEKLKPIEAFYEIKVGNILEKQFGKENVKTITDEYGNQWREITLDKTIAETTERILLSQYSPKYKNISYNPDKTIDQQDSQERGIIDIEKELKILRTMLPEAPVKVYEALVNEGDIEGRFYNGIIEIATGAREGVMYHEAFHAVTQMYLSPFQRKKLYQEAAKKYGDLSPLQLEEKLAEEFRDYMLAMGEFKKSKSRGKVIDWLFRNLKDLIDFFNGKKSRKSKLFEKIRQGRYAHQPKFQVEKTLYSIMPKRIQGDTKMIREAVAGITYSWFNKSNIISFESDFDFNKNQKEVKQIFDEIYLEFEDRYMATEDPILEERYESILENWELYIAAAKIELKKFNINIKEDLEVDEENVSGDLNIKPAIHFSGKRNANNDVKFMIKMLQSTNKSSEYFGENFPVLANFNESWRLLEYNLSNLTPRGNEDLQTVMLGEIEAMSEFYEPFKELLSKLKSPDVPAFKKRAFFKTFSKQTNDLRGTVYDQNKEGEWTVKMMDADSQKQSVQMVNGWVEKFKLDKTLGESLLDRPNLKSQLSRFTNLKKAVLQKNKENGKLPYNAYEILSEILSAIGINVSSEGVRSFSYSFPGSTSSGKFLEALHSINFIFNKSDTSIEKLISGESKFQVDKNFINDNNIVKKLALHETKFKKHKPDNMVVGADGKTYWTESLNHNMAKEMNRWKNDIEHLKRLTSAKYHNRSVYLKHIQSQIEDGLNDNFGLEVFLFNRVEGDMNDYGVEYSELTDIDDTVERMQGVLNGAVYASGSSFSTLTHGDRSVWTKLKGMKFYKFNAGFGEFGKGNAGAAINIFYNYALAEIERISDLKKTNSNISIFKDKGLKSEFFPQLSFDGDLAKELELYGENGELNLSEENQIAIKKHVGTSLKNLVNSEFNKMFESGAIVEKSQRELEYEKKKGNLSNNTFKIIGLDNTINLTYDINDKKQGRENFYSMVADFVLNQTIANIETTMMFTGDPAFYKDLAKRTQMISATGEDLIFENLNGLMENSIHRVKEHFNVKIGKVDDVDMSTSNSKEVRDRYKNNLERLAKDIQTRKKVSKKRAKEIATVEMAPYRNITQADGQGWITPSRFREVMIGFGKWNEDLHDPIYDKLVNDHGDVENISKLLLDLGFPLGQPLKGQHFELVYDEKTKRMIPFSLKYSQAILWPSIIKGTALESLYQKMVVDDVQEFVDPTAVKFGGHNIGSFENHGESIKLSNYNWRLQNDLPSKYHKTGKAPKGTQPPKNIMANLEGKNFKIDEENITADEMISRINSVESKISDLGKQRLTKEFKLSSENKIQDTDGFVRSIVKQLLKDDMPQNVVRPLDENSKTPLDVIFQSGDKIENTIASKVIKSTVKIPANGGQFIQMSNQGFERMKGYKNISEMPVKTRENLIWLTNEAELKGPRIEMVNGEEIVKPGQVFIPYKVVEKIPDFEERVKSGELTGAMIKEMLGDTLNLIGYRIPNQNLTSNDSLEIAGILPPFAGDSVVTFTEIPAKTGSDFDIDKMYTLMYNTKWNKETGKLEKIKPFKNKEGFEIPSVKSLENERIDLWRAVLESPEMFPQLIKPLDAQDLKNNAYYIEVLGKVRDNQTTEGNKVLEAMGYETIDEFLNDPKRESKAVTYLEDEKLEALEFFSPSHQLKLKEQNMAGKAGIGQTANHVVHISLAQQSKLQFGVKILNRGNFDESGTTLYNETNENGDYITQVISSWLNAYVDNAKDPYISYINNNLRTAPTVFMLLRAGIDPNWVNSFMSQPIMKAYVKNLRRTNTRLKENVFSNEENISLYVDQNGILKKYTKNSKVKDAIAQTFDDFGFSLKDLSLHIDETPLLKTNDLERQIVDPDPNIQAEVLKKFLQLQKYAKELNTVVSASKADVGAISNVADAMSQHFKIERALEQPNLINVDKILSTNNMLSTFHNNSARLLMDMLSDKFLHATASAQYTVARIADVLGLDLTDSGAIKKILHHFKNYSLSDAQILHLNQDEQKEMLYGKNSMAVKMNILKELFSDSVLFESFRIDLNEEGDPQFVYVPSSKTKDPADHDALWQEWEHFFNTHEDNPGSRLIGKKEPIDLPVLPMTGDNISDILEGYKSVTSRTKFIKDGEYQLPGGHRVKVTNLSPTKEPVLFKQFTDSEKYAKLEGFESVEDMQENAKFPWTKAWIEGKRKLFAYRITPVSDERTDLRVSDVMKDLVKFSYMTSGFNKNLFSFHDLIPYTYMRGDLNVYDENVDQKGSFYRFVKHKLKELNNTIMYDESFIEQFVQHNVHDDAIVPGLNYNDKIVRPVEDKKKNGFYINSGNFPTKFNATPFNKIITPKQYVKLTLEGNSYLYKLAGEVEGKIFYEAINKLGYYKKGRYVYEYKVDKTVKSIINESVEGLPEDVKMKLNDVLDDGYSNELGEIIEGVGDVLRFSEANMVSFKPVEVVENGKKGFKYVAEVKREDKSTREFDIGATAGPSIAFAKNWAFEKLSALTKEDIDNITNNPC